MALTTEQLAEIEYQKELSLAREYGRLRLEALRMAQQIVVENQRILPVSDRSVSMSDILETANTLYSYSLTRG